MFGISDTFVEECLSTFGSTNQCDILIEECSELIKALCEMKRTDKHFSIRDPYESLKEELAHVAISSAVIARIYGISDTQIQEEVNKKRRKYNFKSDV